MSPSLRHTIRCQSAGKPSSSLGEQGRDIIPQLDSGVHALLVDVWYGRDAGNGAVRTSARSYEDALAVANEELGPDIVAAALRVVDAVAPGEPQGDEKLYMCHGLCETGATSFDATLSDVRAWLDTHPDEVLSVFIEDHVDAADIGAAVESAGLSDYVYTMTKGAPFPTLGEMIRSGRRLVVMLETGDGRPRYPWLVNGFEFVQETPYSFRTEESFNCDPNRGRARRTAPADQSLVGRIHRPRLNAKQVNTADVLGTRAEQCRKEHDLQPRHFVAVNYADIGDLIAVVNQLNGVAGRQRQRSFPATPLMGLRGWTESHRLVERVRCCSWSWDEGHRPHRAAPAAGAGRGILRDDQVAGGADGQAEGEGERRRYRSWPAEVVGWLTGPTGAGRSASRPRCRWESSGPGRLPPARIWPAWGPRRQPIRSQWTTLFRSAAMVPSRNGT